MPTLPRNGWVQPVEPVPDPPPGSAMPVKASPGNKITSEEDVNVAVGNTEDLPSAPAKTRSLQVQITDGSDSTLVRVREKSGTAGTGRLLKGVGSSTLYGGVDGAVADLEVENVGDDDAKVGITFEGDA